jgi:hypothetical protein
MRMKWAPPISCPSRSTGLSWATACCMCCAPATPSSACASPTPTTARCWPRYPDTFFRISKEGYYLDYEQGHEATGALFSSRQLRGPAPEPKSCRKEIAERHMLEQVQVVLETQHIHSLDYELPIPGAAPRVRQGEHAAPAPVRHFEARLVATGAERGAGPGARHQRAQAHRRADPAAGLLRQPDGHPQSASIPRNTRSASWCVRARSATRSSPCCSWTSTPSSASTTRSATTSATTCSRSCPSACAKPRARATWSRAASSVATTSRAWAATSSPS